MENLMIGLYIICGLALLVGGAALVVALKNSRKKQTFEIDENFKVTLDASVSAAVKAAVKETEDVIKVNNAMVTGAINSLNENYHSLLKSVDELKSSLVEKFNALKIELLQNDREQNKSFIEAIDALKTSIRENFEAMRVSNEKSIDTLRKSNEEALKQMREVVDEKLNATLDNRFNQSFKLVGDRLEEINRSFAELQGLQSSVGDLSKILSNVKTRGSWGEVLLENLLSQLLTSSQYERQKQLKRGSRELVDFAIRLPGKGDGTVYLPIDSKFPLEDYRRLQNAEESADIAAIEEAKKALFKRIKTEAMSIRDKYVNPPTTTNFAIMYLPIEGLYGEVLKNSELVESIQHDYRIVICGPTTLAALLNSLQLGFTTLTVEKQSQQIARLLKQFETDFDKFLDLLRKSYDKIGSVQKSIGEAERKADKIKQNLSKISVTDEQQEQIGDESAAQTEEAASDIQ